MYFDTHAHLDDEQFDGIRDAVVMRAREAGVKAIVTVGATAATSATAVDLARRYDGVYAAVGIQPNYCAEAHQHDWDRIERLVDEAPVVAVGETGLDRYWDYAPLEVQRDYFERHLSLAQRRDLPVIIHMRDAEEDVLAMLREARRRGALRGVMHAFTGSREAAAECVELGLTIGFAGMVTYKRATELREVARAVPDDRIVIETDSPYLSPHPVRGHRPNEPALVVHIAACLAEVRGLPVEQFATQTTQNARRLFFGAVSKPS